MIEAKEENMTKDETPATKGGEAKVVKRRRGSSNSKKHLETEKKDEAGGDSVTSKKSDDQLKIEGMEKIVKNGDSPRKEAGNNPLGTSGSGKVRLVSREIY